MFATGEGPLGLENAFLRYSRMAYYLALPAPNGSGGIHECAWHWGGPNREQEAFTVPSISPMHDAIARHRGELEQQIAGASEWEMGAFPAGERACQPES